jgi:hypothetical protein
MARGACSTGSTSTSRSNSVGSSAAASSIEVPPNEWPSPSAIRPPTSAASARGDRGQVGAELAPLIGAGAGRPRRVAVTARIHADHAKVFRERPRDEIERRRAESVRVVEQRERTAPPQSSSAISTPRSGNASRRR